MSKNEGCHIFQIKHTSVVQNSHTTAQNNRLCVIRSEGYRFSMNQPDIGGAELSRHSAEHSRLCLSRDESFHISRTDHLSDVHHSTRQWNACEQIGRLPYFANRPVIGVAELSHHSTEQQALCEGGRKLPFFANRPAVGGAELSHHSSTEQRALCEQG